MSNQYYLTQTTATTITTTVAKSQKGNAKEAAKKTEEKTSGAIELGAFVMVPLSFFQGQYTELTASELRVLLYIFYRTLGYRDPLTGGRKVRDAISHSQFLKGITRRSSGERLDCGAGVSERSLDRALVGLEEKGFIRRQLRTDQTGRCLTTIYELNLQGAGASWLAGTPGIASSFSAAITTSKANPTIPTTVIPSSITTASSTVQATTGVTETPLAKTPELAPLLATEKNTPPIIRTVKEELVETPKPAPHNYNNPPAQNAGLVSPLQQPAKPTPFPLASSLSHNYVKSTTAGSKRSLFQQNGYSRKIAGVSRVKLRETKEFINKRESFKTTQMCVIAGPKDSNRGDTGGKRLIVATVRTGKNQLNEQTKSKKASQLESLIHKDENKAFLPVKLAHQTTEQDEKQALELELVEAGIASLKARYLAELAYAHGHRAGPEDGYVKACLAYIGQQNGVKNRTGLLVYLIRINWHPTNTTSPFSTNPNQSPNSACRPRMYASWQKYGETSGESARSVDTDPGKKLSTNSAVIETEEQLDSENPATLLPSLLDRDLGLALTVYGELPTVQSCQQAWLRVCQKAVRDWGIAHESLLGSWLTPLTTTTGALCSKTNLFLHLSDPASLAPVRYRFSQQIRQELGLGLEWKILDAVGNQGSGELELLQDRLKASLAG